MKKIIFNILSAAALSALTIHTASAKIWRLNNNGGTPNPAIVADFTGTLQAAHDNASVQSGDTIHIEQSSVSYGSCTFTKRLVLIGAGYFLASNPQTQVITNLNSKVDNLNFYAATSAGSVVMGLYGTIMNVGVNDVRLERNNIGYVRLGQASGANPNVTGVKIYQNYLRAYNNSNSIWNNGGTGGTFTVEIIGNAFTGSYVVDLDSRVGGLFANNSINTLYNSLNIQNFTVKNNIQYNPANYSGSANVFNNCIVSYNIGTRDNLFVSPNATGSSQLNNNQTKTLTQIGWTGAEDLWVKLPSGSAAIGQGEGGVDCGATGGTIPYKQSGIPAVPNIYQLTVGSVPAGATSIAVTVSAKSNN